VWTPNYYREKCALDLVPTVSIGQTTSLGWNLPAPGGFLQWHSFPKAQLRHANLSQPLGLTFAKVDIGELIGNFV